MIAFGVLGCDRCLGCEDAIAIWDVGVRSRLGMWECDRFSDKITTYL